MTTERRWIGVTALCLAGSVASLLAGCVEAPQDEAGEAAGAESPPAGPGGAAGETDAAASAGARQDSAAALRGALPELFGIMVGLQDDMRRLDRGLWMEDYDSIAAAARAVADHPTVPPEEFQLISGVLGDAMAGFREMDMNVHDRAVEIEEHARAGRLEDILGTGARLRTGCVQCHTAYRQQLREGLAGVETR